MFNVYNGGLAVLSPLTLTYICILDVKPADSKAIGERPKYSCTPLGQMAPSSKQSPLDSAFMFSF